MILKSVEDIAELKIESLPHLPPIAKILMVSPEFYRIAYSINSHMVDANGALKQVDLPKAQKQWETLKSIFAALKLDVEVIPAHPELPDMVFTANQSLPFWNSEDSSLSVILSYMTAAERRPEVDLFREWYKTQDIYIDRVNFSDLKIPFEGMGDALWHPTRRLLFGGYGFRSSQRAYEVLSHEKDVPILPLHLENPYFYHLDTCLSPLNSRVAAIVLEAFKPSDIKMLEACFESLIPIPLEEAQNLFAGNCFSPNGREVIIQRGTLFAQTLRDHGFEVIEVDLSEFSKAGGNVFCMKLGLFRQSK